MWDLLPSKIKFGIASVISIAVFIFFSKVIEQPFFRSVSYTITTITILAWVVGKYLWKYVYMDFFKRKLCPDFNGEWSVEIESNFNGGTKVRFPVKIEADFFSIKMKANTTLGRTYSNYCRVVRTEDDCFELEYMFKGFNDITSPTDAPFYEGAARLRVLDVSTMEMKGVYWTNRCWQNGENTAGIIYLKKLIIDHYQ